MAHFQAKLLWLVHTATLCVCGRLVSQHKDLPRLPFVGTRSQHLCNQAAHQYNKLHCLPGARRCLNRVCWITCKDKGVMYTHVWWQTAVATGTLSTSHWDALTFPKYDAAWVLNFWLLTQEGGTTPRSSGAFLFLELPFELYVAPKYCRSKVRVSHTAADQKRRLNDVVVLHSMKLAMQHM